MRWAIILLVFLAGCAGSSTDPDQAGPDGALEGAALYQAEHFPGVNGTATRSGIYESQCGTPASGRGQAMASHSPMGFLVPANATMFRVVATWTADHDRLDFSVYDSAGGAGWGGASPAASDFFVDAFTSRGLSIRIDPPACRPPASVDHYDDVEVSFAVSFW